MSDVDESLPRQWQKYKDSMTSLNEDVDYLAIINKLLQVQMKVTILEAKVNNGRLFPTSHGEDKRGLMRWRKICMHLKRKLL